MRQRIAHGACAITSQLMACVQRMHVQLTNSEAWGYALLNFKPNALVFELWLYNIISPRGGSLNIGNPGTLIVDHGTTDGRMCPP